MSQVKRVAVTGAAGQIGYSLLPMIANGGIFGPDTEIALQLLEIPPVLPGPRGRAHGARGLRLPRCCASMVVQRQCPKVAFKDTRPHACSSAASRAGRAWSARTCCRTTARSSSARGRQSPRPRVPDVRVVVVGNPCNTNCLIAMHNAKGVPADRFTAMTRLDQNRAKAQLAQQGGQALVRGPERHDLGQPQQHAVPGLAPRNDRGPGRQPPR